MGKRILALIFLGTLSIALLALILVSAATGWRYSFFDGSKTEPHDSPPIAEANNQESETPSPAAPAGNSDEPPAGNTPPAADEPPADAPPANDPPASAEPSAGKPMADPGAADPNATEIARYIPGAASMSTDAKANAQVAQGFTYENGGWQVISEDSEIIPDFSLLAGGWMAVMITDPDTSPYTDYLNIEIQGTESDAVLIFNWGERHFSADGKTVDESGKTSRLSGQFKDGTILAKGDGSIAMTRFLIDHRNGKEYASAIYAWPDGTRGYMGLVR